MADYLKIPELARRLDVSEKTARRYVKRGVLPSAFIGGAYRVTEVDLEAFLHGAEVKPEDASPKAERRSSPEPSNSDDFDDERRPPLPAAVLMRGAGHVFLTHSLAETAAFAEAASQDEIRGRIRALAEELGLLREAARHLTEYVPELFRPPPSGKDLPHAKDIQAVRAAKDEMGAVASGFVVRVKVLAAIGGPDLADELERLPEPVVFEMYEGADASLRK